MAHKSDVRFPINSDPATTAGQAEEDIHCPNGCGGGRWLDCPRSSWLTTVLRTPSCQDLAVAVGALASSR